MMDFDTKMATNDQIVPTTIFNLKIWVSKNVRLDTVELLAHPLSRDLKLN